MTRMVARDFNHPSIILVLAMAPLTMHVLLDQRADPSLIQYEGAVRRRWRPISFARCMRTDTDMPRGPDLSPAD